MFTLTINMYPSQAQSICVVCKQTLKYRSVIVCFLCGIICQKRIAEWYPVIEIVYVT